MLIGFSRKNRLSEKGGVMNTVQIIEIIIIIGLLINLVMAILFGLTSVKKGYWGTATGILTILFGLPGMIYACALSKKETKVPESKRQTVFVIVLFIIFAAEVIGSALIVNKVNDIATTIAEQIEESNNRVEEANAKSQKITDALDEIQSRYDNNEITYDDYYAQIQSAINGEE